MAQTMTSTAALKTAPAGRIDANAIATRQRDTANRLRERSEQTEAQTEKLHDLRSAWQKALEEGDIDQLKIINADFDSAGKERARLRGDVTEMMMSLLEGYKDIGIAVEAAQKFSSEEERILDAAKKLVEAAEGELPRAQAIRWNILGARDKAIAKAKENIETAKAAIQTANREAEAMRRERLNNMDFSQSLQLQQAVVAELTERAQGRIAIIEDDLTVLQQNVNDTMDKIRDNTQLQEELDGQLDQANAEIGTLNEELASYKENSSEWLECRERIILKTRARDDLETERNAAFERAGEGQRFLEFNRQEEQGTATLLALHKQWISLMQMGSEQRDILYERHIRFIQGAADQEGLSRADQMATQTDEHMVMESAMTTQAMRRGMLERLHSMPDQTRRLRQIREADTQAQADFEQEVLKLIEEFGKNLGTQSTYDDRAAHRSAQPPA